MEGNKLKITPNFQQKISFLKTIFPLEYNIVQKFERANQKIQKPKSFPKHYFKGTTLHNHKGTKLLTIVLP